MKNLFLLFNHTLTSVQDADARNSLGVDRIIAAPKDIQQIWSQVPPDLDGLTQHLQPVFSWLEAEARSGDCILLQGDFGAVYLTVQYAVAANYVPVYSTTERHAEEQLQADGTVKISRSFRHVRFRKYGV